MWGSGENLSFCTRLKLRAQKLDSSRKWVFPNEYVAPQLHPRLSLESSDDETDVNMAAGTPRELATQASLKPTIVFI